MHDDRWWGWAALIVIFLVIRAFQALFKTRARAKPIDGLARMNAAAERILKERGASGRQGGAANPIPRTNAAPPPKPAGKRGRPPKSQVKPQIKPQAKPQGKPQAKPQAKPSPAMPRVQREPAVIRRDGFLSAGREPVIQRRR